MLSPDCLTCQGNARIDELPDRERIGLDEHWRVAHAFDTALPGWLVLVPRRHLTAIAELTDAEAATLGLWQVRLSRALHAVLGCPKTYVVQFAEAQAYAHVHFHVVPRSVDLAEPLRGTGIFRLLNVPADEAVSEGRRDELTSALRHALG